MSASNKANGSEEELRSRLENLRDQKLQSDEVIRQQESEIANVRSQNESLKKRLDSLENLVNMQVMSILKKQQDLDMREANLAKYEQETSNQPPLNPTETAVEQENKKLIALMLQNKSLNENLDRLKRMAEEESNKLDMMEREDKLKQEQLQKEVEKKQMVLKQKEKEIEEMKQNKSLSGSQNLSKLAKDKQPGGKIKTPSRHSGWSHNSWLESDEDSKDSSKRHGSSAGAGNAFKQAPQVPPKPVVEPFTIKSNRENSGGKHSHDKYSEPIAESVHESHTNNTEPEPVDMISPIKKDPHNYRFKDTRNSGKNHYPDHNKGSGGGGRNDYHGYHNQQQRNSGDYRGNNHKDRNYHGHRGGQGKLDQYKLASKEPIAEDTEEHRGDYNEKYKNIKYYDDYVKKYKSNVKRKYETLQENDYIARGKEDEEEYYHHPIEQHASKKAYYYEEEPEDKKKKKKANRRKKKGWFDIDDSFDNGKQKRKESNSNQQNESNQGDEESENRQKEESPIAKPVPEKAAEVHKKPKFIEPTHVESPSAKPEPRRLESKPAEPSKPEPRQPEPKKAEPVSAPPQPTPQKKPAQSAPETNLKPNLKETQEPPTGPPHKSTEYPKSTSKPQDSEEWVSASPKAPEKLKPSSNEQAKGKATVAEFPPSTANNSKKTNEKQDDDKKKQAAAVERKIGVEELFDEGDEWEGQNRQEPGGGGENKKKKKKKKNKGNDDIDLTMLLKK